MLTLKCAVICHCSVFLSNQLSHVCALSALLIFVRHTLTYVTYFPLRSGLWVKMTRKACWLAYREIWPDVVGQPGTFGRLHFTYYVIGNLKSFSAIINSRVVWILEHTLNFPCDQGADQLCVNQCCNTRV